MACKAFSVYTAHETIIWILKKLHGYSWAAKGVTALAAFALDYGEPWRVSKMGPTKADSLEIHISSDEGLEKTTEATADCNTLVHPAMKLIKVVVDVEKLIGKFGIDEYLPTLDEIPRDIYTYWAIFALLASAGRMAS